MAEAPLELLFYPEEYRTRNPLWPYEISSGAVVFRTHNKQLYVLLLKRRTERGGYSYHLPKGTVRVGETLEDAAKREIAEEAAVDVEIIGYLGAVSRNAYKSRMPGSKTIHFFAARYKRSHENQQLADGYETVEWMTPKRANALLAKNKVKREDILVKRMVQFVKILKG